MDADEMVDAALAGLDFGEAVTIPSLPDMAEWSRFNGARLAMGPNLSLAHGPGDTIGREMRRDRSNDPLIPRTGWLRRKRRGETTLQ
jgi:hypothetical protein